MMKMKWLLSIAALILGGCAKPHLEIFPELSRPELVSTLLTVEQMHEDIDALVAGVKARHPALEQYTDLAELSVAVEQAKADITSPMTRVAFYRTVGALSHRFRDGHAFLLWPFQEYQTFKEQGGSPFPFDVSYIEGQLTPRHDYQSGERQVRTDMRITHINQQPVESVFDVAQQFVGGESKALRNQIVARRFPVVLWSVFGHTKRFTLRVMDNGVAKHIEIRDGQSWQKMVEGEEPKNRDFFLTYPKQDTAYLHIGHFDIDPDWFEDFIDEQFADLADKQVQTLIVDIRKNPGGNTDAAAYLARHLADKRFRMVSSVQEKLNGDNRGWFNYRGEAGDMLSTQWEDWYSPAKNTFKGDKYVMIGTISYSAAIVFATTIQDFDFATVVGEPTGGFANQSAQGNLFNLPHSELRAYVATKLLVRPSGQSSSHHVQPDWPVAQRLDRDAPGYDGALTELLNAIEQQEDGNNSVARKHSPDVPSDSGH